ncbi:MAG: LysR family transcriptional regulator [Gammaproteobacteria bacterium]|jgi:LysR family transcriptional regulator for metE and metH
MPRLDLRHLSMLRAIAESRTLADAATTLNLTPSALTHRLKEAERRIGRKLVDREHTPTTFTEAGRRLAAAARGILDELEQAEADAGMVDAMKRVAVRLSGSTLCGYGWLAGLVRALEVAHPQIDLEVVMDVALDPIGALKKRAIDLAIMPERTRDARLRNVALYRDEMVAVVPRGHRLTAGDHAEIRDFADVTYVANSTTPEIGREYTRLFKPAGVRPRRVVQAGHVEAVMGVVRAGIGVTISTRSTAEPFAASGELVLLPLTPGGQYLTWFGTCFASGPDNRAARDVLTMLARVTAV